MELTELTKKFAEFLETNYQVELLENVRKGKKSIQIDFSKLITFEPEIGDLLLDDPEETLKAFELSIEQLNPKAKNFTVRVKNLPESTGIFIRNIRSKELGKFLTLEGVVRRKSDVRPHVTSAKFECPSCGNTISILQLDNKFKEPSRCSCGRKGKFRLLNKELVDAQGLVLEEIPEKLDGGEQPKRLDVFLKNDLVSPLSEKKTNPGSRIVLTGIVKEVPIITRSGAQSTKFDLVFEANCVDSVEEDFNDISISKEEEEKIITLSKDPKINSLLIESVAPSIYGHEKIKEALLLQLVGGVRKVREDGGVTRGDIHMLLVGDPGGGKSQILKRVGKIGIKARYVTGRGASGAGLTATVVKDEFIQGWSLEAGALVLANKGIAAIDELDKMSKEDTWSMHEAMEQQSVSISKANIQATLRCETTIIAAANPKFGRFDPYETVASQINLPSTLINRFDLIFPIKDLPDEKKDEKLASFILELHKDDSYNEAEIPTDLLRKYIAYAKQNFRPKLTQMAIDEIKEYFLKLRQGASASGTKTIPISARQLEGLVRLSEASAKIRLSDKVMKKDAQKAVALLDYCLRQVAFDEETGTIDIDRIATEMPATQRNKLIKVKEIIIELEKQVGKLIPLEDLIQAAAEQGLEENEVEEAIQKLKRAGDVYEPKNGFLSRI
ncbi:minichromosome maintenance protein MCM [archaeon]|nr:minichromosome maintenance protein MCM [archaeon]